MAPTRNKERSTVVVVGAGPGIGYSTARRFAAEGYDAGLIARNELRLEELTAQLLNDVPEATVEHVAADASDATELRKALGEIDDRLGPIDVVVFSPLPAIDRIKPVLDTSSEDLAAALALSVGGAVTVVSEVVQAMIERRSGSLLFTTGSGATHPSADRAASAVATTSAAVYFRLLHEALSATEVNVAHLTIRGGVGPGLQHEPDTVAEVLWDAHRHSGDGFPTLE